MTGRIWLGPMAGAVVIATVATVAGWLVQAEWAIPASLEFSLVQSALVGLAVAALLTVTTTRPLTRVAHDLTQVNPLKPGHTAIPAPRGHERDALGRLVARINLLLGTMALRERERARQQQALAKSEERLRLAITATRSGIWDYNLETGEFWWSPEFLAVLGHAPGDLEPARETWRSLVHPDDLPETERRWTNRAQGAARTFRLVYRMSAKGGAWVWIKDRVLVVRGEDGQPVRFTGLIRDITAQKQADDQLKYLATHDQLTGLPNRTLIRDRLQQALPAAGAANGKVATLFIDVDRFKQINETLGHGAGDTVLSALAQRLAVAAAGHTLGRLGSDQFVILLAPTQDAEIARLPHALLAVMAEPFQVEGRAIQLTASIGISVFPDDASDAASLMKHADAAVAQAKASSGNSYRFYTGALHERALSRLSLEQNLYDAVERESFELWYQPKVCAHSLDVVGFEALLRWRCPQQGFISPAQFIPIAEENGLILPIGDWVLETACRRMAQWRLEGLRPPPVAVNLSARQLRGRALVDRIAGLLDQYGLAPDLLEIEMTESALMGDIDRTAPILAEIRDLGVGISIDDFGTGYSSLAYLRRLPIRTLKIDRAFVRNLPDDEEDATITRAIIGLGRQLGLHLVAEGVETEDQMTFLRASGCDTLQGFLFSPARPGHEVARMIAHPPWRPERWASWPTVVGTGDHINDEGFRRRSA